MYIFKKNKDSMHNHHLIVIPILYYGSICYHYHHIFFSFCDYHSRFPSEFRHQSEDLHPKVMINILKFSLVDGKCHWILLNFTWLFLLSSIRSSLLDTKHKRPMSVCALVQIKSKSTHSVCFTMGKFFCYVSCLRKVLIC